MERRQRNETAEKTAPLFVGCSAFLLNGAGGVWFGYLYRKYGLSYAMLAHALVHVVSDVIWAVFI
jgi:membrane protease YdiL (CAAX protease family)